MKTINELGKSECHLYFILVIVFRREDFASIEAASETKMEPSIDAKDISSRACTRNEGISEVLIYQNVIELDDLKHVD